MQKNNNLQEIFLTKARKQSIPLTIFLMNGFQLRGVVTGFDCFTVVLDTDVTPVPSRTPLMGVLVRLYSTSSS